MKKAIQQRTLETRARLIEASHGLVNKRGFEALRIEDVALRAGVAKGTFFAHFKDKDELMDLLIGEHINKALDRMAALPAPKTVGQLAKRLLTVMEIMGSERYVFDVILRRSGAAAVADIGPIAMGFGRLEEITGQWLTKSAFRQDVPTDTLVEGVEAFVIQTLALNFCALHSHKPMQDRLLPYLRAWLLPPAK